MIKNLSYKKRVALLVLILGVCGGIMLAYIFLSIKDKTEEGVGLDIPEIDFTELNERLPEKPDLEKLKQEAEEVKQDDDNNNNKELLETPVEVEIGEGEGDENDGGIVNDILPDGVNSPPPPPEVVN